MEILKNILINKEIRGLKKGATAYCEIKVEEFFWKYENAVEFEGVKLQLPQSPYLIEMSIIAQLGVAIGKDKLEDFGQGKNNDFLNEIKKQYGNQFYEEIRIGLNEIQKSKNKKEILNKLQNLILNVCYTKKYEEITDVNEAMTFFSELKDINEKRGHIEADDKFQKFYEEKYEKIIEEYPENLAILDALKYKEPEFLRATENLLYIKKTGIIEKIKAIFTKTKIKMLKEA